MKIDIKYRKTYLPGLSMGLESNSKGRVGKLIGVDNLFSAAAWFGLKNPNQKIQSCVERVIEEISNDLISNTVTPSINLGGNLTK